MATRVPFLSISGPSGGNVVPGLGDALLGVTITDHEGGESDECVIRMADRPPFNTPPAKGTPYTVTIGWRGGAGTMTGIYAFETFRKTGDPDEGHSFELVCRAADFLDKMKVVETRHYDAENGFGTAGAIFERLAADAGVSAAIDGEIAGIAIPYRLRWQQSAMDFAAELATAIGAVVKPQAGNLVVRKAGAGRSASGGALPALTIRRDPSYGYDFDIDPRPQHREIGANWFDPAKGCLREALETTAAQFSRLALPHPAPSEDEAHRIAKAAGTAENRASGSGSVEIPGNAAAVGGAPARLSGFGPGVDDRQWQIASATHEVNPGADGWITTVELEAREVPCG